MLKINNMKIINFVKTFSFAMKPLQAAREGWTDVVWYMGCVVCIGLILKACVWNALISSIVA